MEQIETIATDRPAQYRKRHKFAAAWRVWCAVVDFIFRTWPRNK
jgi:hypothetical protein